MHSSCVGSEKKSLLVILFLIVMLSGCSENEPIKIGFSGGLTGKHADLGLYGRNGILLAIEEVNSRGGIRGRPIELIVKDDKQDAVIAAQVDEELIAEGVIAIIGHFTSAMSVAGVPVANRKKILMFSPTSSTNQLSGIDDYFMRVMSSNIHVVKILAEQIFEKTGVDSLALVYDDQNRAFGKDWVDYFGKRSKERGNTLRVYPFDSRKDFSFSQFASEVSDSDADGVLVVANALDAAMFCQQIRKAGSEIPIFTTMWSMSNDFLQHGGTATEGVSFTNWFDPKHPGEKSLNFRKNYTERFGQMPTFASHFSYEATMILIEALQRNSDPSSLKATIIQQEIFEGTQGQIRIDKYGDADRSPFIMTVKDGQFVKIGQP